MNNEIEKLVNKLNEYRYKYYNNSSEINDEEFDYYENKLRQLDPTNPYFKQVGAKLEKDDEEVEIIPGITASSSAGSVVGAPLMHDNCNISLSDLMTPYEDIKKRVKAAAESDFIISLYNPKSKGRPHYLRECIDIIREFREDTTPIAVVKHALRDGQEVTMTTIGEFNDENVDMMSIVIVGNTKSFYKNGSFITPRGYNDKKRDKVKK